MPRNWCKLIRSATHAVAELNNIKIVNLVCVKETKRNFDALLSMADFFKSLFKCVDIPLNAIKCRPSRNASWSTKNLTWPKGFVIYSKILKNKIKKHEASTARLNTTSSSQLSLCFTIQQHVIPNYKYVIWNYTLQDDTNMFHLADMEHYINVIMFLKKFSGVSTRNYGYL